MKLLRTQNVHRQSRKIHSRLIVSYNHRELNTVNKLFTNGRWLTEVFPCFFLGCKANARGTACTLPIVVLSMYCLCVNVYYCHRVTTQLQLTNISYHIMFGKSFKRFSTLKSHASFHTAEYPHECTLCPDKFKLLYELQKHSLAHVTARPFKCKLCDRKFRHIWQDHLIFYGRPSHDLCSNCKITSCISLMNQNVIPYDKNQDLCRLSWQSEASNGSLLLPHIAKCFKVYHQNIWGLQNKTNKLISFLSPTFPHIIV